MMMSKAIKFLVIWIGVTWFLIGFLLLPLVEHIVLSSGGRAGPAPPLNYIGVMFSGIRGFIFLAIVPALLIVVVLAGKIRDVFDRLMSGMLLIFHLFPTVALALNSSLYSMFFPTGIYILLTSPWNPIFVILPRDDPWLILGDIPIPLWLVYPSDIFGKSYFFFGVILFLVGLGVFAVAFVQQLKGKGLGKSRLYLVVRYLQYFGLILTTFGLTLMVRWYATSCWGGLFLFLVGLGVFAVAFIQQLKGKGLVTSGLYSVVRHPQYLGLILTTLGFTLAFAPYLMSVIAWITLILGYILLADKEEADLERKYGEKFLSYKRRVPFILPLFSSLYKYTSKGTLEPWMPTSKLKRYTFLLCIYLLTVTLTIIILRAYSIAPWAFGIR
jgi:hypothetical protein